MTGEHKGIRIIGKNKTMFQLPSVGKIIFQAEGNLDVNLMSHI